MGTAISTNRWVDDRQELRQAVIGGVWKLGCYPTVRAIDGLDATPITRSSGRGGSALGPTTRPENPVPDGNFPEVPSTAWSSAVASDSRPGKPPADAPAPPLLDTRPGIILPDASVGFRSS